MPAWLVMRVDGSFSAEPESGSGSCLRGLIGLD